MKKQIAGYVSLAMAVVVLVGGLHLSHDMALGYAGIALAFVIGLLAFRLLRVSPSS
jgi:hypothetical protein